MWETCRSQEKQLRRKPTSSICIKQVIEKAIGPVRRITIAYETGTGKIEFKGTQEEAEEMSTILIGAARDIFDQHRRQLRFSAIRPRDKGKGKGKEERVE